jgi:hypothetical protein
MLFLKHWRARDDAGRLLRIALAWVQYQSGRGTPILDDVHYTIPYLESRWIPSLRRSLAQIDARFMLDKTYVAPIQREQDEYLMTHIQDSTVFSDRELHIMYCCWLYMNAVTVSDLTTACGSFLDPSAKQHERPQSSTSKYHRTLQEKPHSWCLWDLALHIWFDKHGQLYLPLGPWLQPGNHLPEDPYGYFPTEITDWSPTLTSIPVHLSPSMATHFGIRRTIPPHNPPKTTRIPATFAQHVDTLPQWERDLLEQVVFDVPPFQLVIIFTNMANFDTSAALQIQFISNGSQIWDSMSFGWCLALPDGTRLAHYSGPGIGPGTSH